MENEWVTVQIMRKRPDGSYLGVLPGEGGRASYPSTPPLPKRGDWVHVLFGEGALVVEELIYQYHEDEAEVCLLCDDPYGLFDKESR